MVGKRIGGRGFGIFSFLVVLADDPGCRALSVWLNGPEEHGLSPWQMTVRIGYTLAGATGAPVRRYPPATAGRCS